MPSKHIVLNKKITHWYLTFTWLHNILNWYNLSSLLKCAAISQEVIYILKNKVADVDLIYKSKIVKKW